MFRKHLASSAKFALAVLLAAVGVVPAQAQIGVLFTGAGAVNRSMGGASTAAPIDAAGALFWNPATMSGLPTSSIDFGVELLWPSTRLSSSVPASGFGPGIPPIGLAGSDRGDNGIFPLPTMALVYRPDDSPFSYGLGIFAVAGFGVNYPASSTNPLAGPVNPILTPQPPRGFGTGALYANLQVIELIPSVAVQVTDRLSVGAGPSLTLANLQLDPLLVAVPNADGTYPSGTHTRMAWGGGFQVGGYYTLDGGWSIGLSYKSTQWMEGFHWQSASNTGAPRNINYRFDIPAIVSLGFGYTGIERVTLAADFRYVDFGNTQGFKQSGYLPTGAVAGLGWRNVFAMSLGAQYELTDAVSVRGGYSYNQDPITAAQSSFNIASPTIIEHSMYFGTSYKVTSSLSLSLGYVHCFQNSVQGPLVTPFGTVAGSNIRNTTSADAVMIGATVLFGGR